VEWFYYVPVSLAIILFWIIIIDYKNEQAAENVIKRHQELFSEEEQGMLLSSPSIFMQQVTFTTSFAQVDPNSALGHSTIISVIYALISLYFSNWPSLIICILVILYVPLTMRDSFYQGSENDEKHAISRYLKSKKINQKTITPKKMQSLSFTYHNILNKLQFITEKTS
jgi:hypothetical protein